MRSFSASAAKHKLFCSQTETTVATTSITQYSHSVVSVSSAASHPIFVYCTTRMLAQTKNTSRSNKKRRKQGAWKPVTDVGIGDGRAGQAE